MLFNLRSSVLIFHRHFSKWKIPVGTDTGIKIYNPILKEHSPLILRNPNISFWYTCGPTVYDSTHIGHASTYVRIDILQRILKKYFNVNLVTAMNITDIDDKIIKRANQDKVHFQEIARKYETEFWEDLQLLNVTSPDIKVHVSNSMELIKDFVQQLLSSESAYKTTNGSVYFRTKNFDRYGKLVPISDDQDSKSHSKESPIDFALWKTAKPDEPFWETSWGKGRPGWHIECSAMASFVFGKSIDFHAGGLDLKFPHHENEEAQSCCYHKTDQWINYWIHTGHLQSTGELVKMSKSLKNTVSVRDLLKSCTPNQFRMLCLTSRYRSAIEFGDDSTTAAKGLYKRISSFLGDSRAYVDGVKPLVDFDVEILSKLRQETQRNIVEAFKDDFNTPKAVECIMHLISETYRVIDSKSSFDTRGSSNIVVIQDIHNFVVEFFENLGFQLSTTSSSQKSENIEEKLIQSLIDVRQEIRDEAVREKNKYLFAVCDKIRQQLSENGIEVKDHGKNTAWKYKNE